MIGADSANTRACQKCLLPEGYLGNGKKLEIDHGMCEFCRMENDYYASVSFSENEIYLTDYLDSVKGRYEYDCIVLYTGGRDSTFTLQQLQHKYQLRILAATWDNGFFSEEQKSNMKEVVNNLGIDHIYVNVEWDLLKAIYKNRLLHFGRFCNCVPLLFLFLAPLIMERKAPVIIFSTSAGQTVNVIRRKYGGSLSEEAYREKVRERGISPLKLLAEEMLDILCVDILTGRYDQKIITQLIPFWNSLREMTQEKDMVSVTPSCFFEWEERKIKRELATTGWKPMFDRGTYNHSSCLAEEVKAYLSYRQNQINLDVLELANYNRYGKIGQSEFRTLLQDSGYCNLKPYYWETFLQRMDMTEGEMEEIINSGLSSRLKAQINADTARQLGIFNIEQLQSRMNTILEERILI